MNHSAPAIDLDRQLSETLQTLARNRFDVDALLAMCRLHTRAGFEPDFIDPSLHVALKDMVVKHGDAPGLKELLEKFSAPGELHAWVWRDLKKDVYVMTIPAHGIRAEMTPEYLAKKGPPPTGLFPLRQATKPVYTRPSGYRMSRSIQSEVHERYRPDLEKGCDLWWEPEKNQLSVYARADEGEYYHASLDYSLSVNVYLDEGVLELFQTLDAE